MGAPNERSGPAGNGTAPGNTTKDHGTLLDAALAYAARGWAVFPLQPVTKRPATPNGFKDATTDREQIRAWWERWPNANIGIATGLVSRIVVLDPDDGAKGQATLDRLEQELGQLPPTFTVRTPGNPDKGKAPGRHVYLWHPGGKIKNRTGDTWRPWGKDQDPAHGLDVRGDGGYVVAPPSQLQAGTYTRDGFGLEANPVPAWAELLRSGQVPAPARPVDPDAALLELAQGAGATKTSNDDEHLDDGAALFDKPGRSFTRSQAKQFIFDHALAPLANAKPGGRNAQLNASAMVCGHFIAGGHGSEEKATKVLTKHARAIGLDDDEIGPTIASGLAAGMAEPYEVTEDPPPPPPRRRRVDLTPYLDGTHVPPVPSVGACRDDGRRLLYPGRWHSVIALTAAGKSWLAIWHAAAELDQGHTVAYCHFEESSPALTIGRLRALGVPDDTIRDRFAWLDCSERWDAKSFDAELEALDRPPALVVLDGINAACSLHGWAVNEPGAVGSYRLTFEKPATRRNAAVLSLGHPPKAPDRQTERHGFGSTAWLDEVDGVGFRMEASAAPIRRGHRGSSRLYAVKDRDDQVQQHGQQMRNRDGWSYPGQFVLDNSQQGLDPDHGLVRITTAELLAPEVDDSAQDLDAIGKLGQAVVEYLEQHGRRFESAARLKDGLRAAQVKYDDGDLGPALLRLVDEGRLEYPETGRGRSRPGWLTDPATSVSNEVDDA